MSAVELRTLAFALIASCGCRDIVGIETRTEGPPLLPLSEGCMRCVNDHCEGAERACAEDAECAALATCVASVGLNDPVRRTACIDAHPRGATSVAFSSLDACSREGCLDACYGPGGFFAAHPPDCLSCTEAACIDEMRACVADASCEASASRAYGDPDRLVPSLIRPVVMTPGDAGREEREFVGCVAACPQECGYDGRDMSCVNAYEWPTMLPPSADVEISVVQLRPDFSAAPLSGATVEACTDAAVGCHPIASTVSNDEGLAAVVLPLSGQFGFRGFARVTGDTNGLALLPTHALGYPIFSDLRADAYVITEEDYSEALQKAGLQRVPGKAQILTMATDCRFRRAPNVTVELPPGAMVDATALFSPTGANGFSFFVNVEPGCYDIVGRTDAVETHRVRVKAAPDVWTIVALQPRSAPLDPGYICGPDFLFD